MLRAATTQKEAGSGVKRFHATSVAGTLLPTSDLLDRSQWHRAVAFRDGNRNTLLLP
jgi:hypothetical protein